MRLTELMWLQGQPCLLESSFQVVSSFGPGWVLELQWWFRVMVPAGC